MSHYNVHVVVDADNSHEATDAITEALEHYSEHREVEPYEEEISDEEVTQALTHTNAQRHEEGRWKIKPDDEANVLKVMTEWIGTPVTRREDGTLIYQTSWNPDGHWDWWVIGGRWVNAFRCRNGGHTDLTRVANIDLPAMRHEAQTAALRQFDAFALAVKGLRVGPTWTEVRDRYPHDRIDDARREYHADPWVQVASRGLWLDDPHHYWCVGEADPRAAFAARCVAGTAAPYAWLQDGIWEQQGYVGMYMGIAGDEDAADQWTRLVAEKWEALYPDLWIANVDCHT